jgi:hypothetical protein
LIGDFSDTLHALIEKFFDDTILRRGITMQNSTLFVQEPDYVAFLKTGLPVQALGAVYDGRDPYATPLGIIIVVLENNMAREIFVRRNTHAQNGRIAYMHDLGLARYVAKRNGFEEAHMRLGNEPVAVETKNLLRAFFEAQNTNQLNGKYFIDVCG